MKKIRFKCRDTHSLPTQKAIKEHLDQNNYVVIEFRKKWWCIAKEWWSEIRGETDIIFTEEFDNKQEADIELAISILSKQFPDYSVFFSGEDRMSKRVTIYPVVSSELIQKHKTQIIEAIDSYIARCIHLEEQRLQGKLLDEWDNYVHGGHCRYENLVTGETVEAPLEIKEKQKDVDPYFLAEYIKSTKLFPEVANLISDKFHDTARILDVLYGRHQK